MLLALGGAHVELKVGIDDIAGVLYAFLRAEVRFHIGRRGVVVCFAGVLQRRARDLNPQPHTGHLISNEAANQFAYPPVSEPIQ